MGQPLHKVSSAGPVIRIGDKLGRELNMLWTSPQLPGIAVHHCGHMTALRPYYVIARSFTRKFRLLKQAQRAADYA
ncbi:hypothetical protein SAMN02745126_06378 [Enhydrobacter aerosaccus]|uniref:Uncharacterized protein n=1 Tax=Enhydrobacter aerosaccus TaxID=225324 RepID=A0A1T4TJA5_9HYPH|nr:hypothetical protein [Enhydrobacter aerosaccus]SKA40560.1 hypothetical protein SAMN02745126_06378 [Enhydrobacter aerosaccus]